MWLNNIATKDKGLQNERPNLNVFFKTKRKFKPHNSYFDFLLWHHTLDQLSSDLAFGEPHFWRWFTQVLGLTSVPCVFCLYFQQLEGGVKCSLDCYIM
jgi:hypothetical protein